MKKIILPTDFSEYAQYAFDFALSIASKTEAEVILIHVIITPIEWANSDVISPEILTQPSYGSVNLFPIIAEMEKEAEEKLKALQKIAIDKNIDCSYSISKNIPIYESINEQITDVEENMVLMGSHGQAGIIDEILGSNAKKVIRNVKIPIIIIKEKQADFNVNNILYVSSFDEKELNDTLVSALKITSIFDATIHLLYINTPGSFEDSNTSLNKLNKVVADYNLTEFTVNIHNHYTIEHGINDFIENNKTDLVVMPSHGYKGLKKIFNFNLAEGIITHIKTPILTLKTT